MIRFRCMCWLDFCVTDDIFFLYHIKRHMMLVCPDIDGDDN